MKKIRLTMPIPPSINHCYFYRGGKKIKTQTARDFEKEVALIMRKIDYRFPDKTKIICEMSYFFPDNIRRDAHNTIKLCLDSVERGGLYKDDRYVLPRIMDWEIEWKA
jgi:crossover junction endodeoxyribonuclease RusA